VFVCGLGHGEGTRFFAALRMTGSEGLRMMSRVDKRLQSRR